MGLDRSLMGRRMIEQRVILLAEDEDNDVYLLRHALEKSGVSARLFVVADGEDAINYLRGEGRYADRTKYPVPCLILTDLKMPRIDGFELLEWTRRSKQLSGIPVVVLSSSSAPFDQDRANELGSQGYYVKGKISASVDMFRELEARWFANPGEPLIPPS